MSQDQWHGFGYRARYFLAPGTTQYLALKVVEAIVVGEIPHTMSLVTVTITSVNLNQPQNPSWPPYVLPYLLSLHQ